MRNQNLLYPLNEFYEDSRQPLPDAVSLVAGQLPEPFRSILAHDRDMTPTLEETYGCAIELRVLKHWLREEVFSRQIVLTLHGRGTAVLFGAIKIYLHRLPPAARALVIEMKQPLGGILREQGIAHSSHPAGYFQVQSDDLIRSALQLRGSATLYGRRNVLLDRAGATLAQVVEILPPGQI